MWLVSLDTWVSFILHLVSQDTAIVDVINCLMFGFKKKTNVFHKVHYFWKGKLIMVVCVFKCVGAWWGAFMWPPQCFLSTLPLCVLRQGLSLLSMVLHGTRWFTKRLANESQGFACLFAFPNSHHWSYRYWLQLRTFTWGYELRFYGYQLNHLSNLPSTSGVE